MISDLAVGDLDALRERAKMPPPVIRSRSRAVAANFRTIADVMVGCPALSRASAVRSASACA
jgi:hypothetical protein